jgi:hypothetical protein
MKRPVRNIHTNKELKMKKILYKAGDALLCLAGFLALALIFAEIAAVGKPAGKIAHGHWGFGAKSSRSYSAPVLP